MSCSLATLLVLSALDAAAPDGGIADAAPAVAPPVTLLPAKDLLGSANIERSRPVVVAAGKLFVRGTSDPVGGAAIIVDGLQSEETEADGRFSLVVAPGRRIVQVQHPGFEPLTHVALIAPGMPLLELRLTPTREAALRYETVVTAPPRHQDQGPVRTLSGPEITRTAGSFGDPFRVIESLPGVAPTIWPLPIYAVRGANPGNTGYFIDGVRVPVLFHFALGPAVIHPYFLESLDFYSAGYPARFGRYVSGVVAASTAAPPADRARGSLDVRLFDAGGILTVPINGGRGTLAIAARYAYPAGLASALVEEVRFHYWDYQARLDHNLGPGRLSLNAFGSFDLFAERPTNHSWSPETGEVVTRGKEQVLRLMFQRFDLRWRGSVPGGRLSAGLALGLDKTGIPFEEENRLGSRARSLTPRVSYQVPLHPTADLELGVDGEIVQYRGTLDKPLEMQEMQSLVGFTSTRPVALLGAHGSLVFRPHDRLVVTPGLRLDFYKEGRAEALDLGPRLNLRLRAAESLWLKLSGGRSTQLPSLPFQLPGIEAFGLAQHGLQSVWQGGLGIEAGLRGLELDATSFLQRYVLTDMRDPEFGDPLLDDFLIRRDALAYGFELMLRRPPGERLHGWLSYTCSRSLRAFEGGVVGPSDWDQRHVLNLVLGYRWGRNTLGTRFHLHTGRPVHLGNVSPQELARLPPFYQLDLRYDRRFVFDSWALDVYLELVNATLTRQVLGLALLPDGVKRDGFRIVLPSLGIRAEF